MRIVILTFLITAIFSCKTSPQLLNTDVKVINGNPQLFIDGKKTLPIMTFMNTGILTSSNVNERQIKYAAEYGGTHLHQINFSLPEKDNGEIDFDPMKSALDLVRRGDPNGKAVLRIHLNGKWSEESKIYREEDRIRFSNGKDVDEISLASDKWFEVTANKLRSLIDFYKKNPKYGTMVAGYFPAAGETGEWFQWEYRDNGVDMSGVNAKKFRLWLRKKYNNDTKKLQDSWKNYIVNFENAHIPADELGAEKVIDKESVLFDKPSDQRVIDYLDYYNGMVTDRIVYLANLIKEETNDKSLVGFFYGYVLDLWEAKSGHYNLEKILNCKDIDFLSSPISYRSRNEGEIGGSMTTVESVNAHGKIWFDECDYRTPIKTAEGLNFADFTPKTKSMEGVYEIYKRQYGFQMIRGNGNWIMDLMGQGWYDEKNFWKEINTLNKIYTNYLNIRIPSDPEVALVIDDYGLALAKDSKFNVWMLERLRDELYTSGVEFGVYTREDIEMGLAPNAKLLIMIGSFRLKTEMVKNLEKELLQKDKTTIWVYSLGLTNESDIKKLTSGKNGSKQIIFESNKLNSNQIRKFAKDAGVHLFTTVVNDVCMVNNNFIVLHTISEGKRTIEFPKKVDVFEQFTNTWYRNVETISLDAPLGKTYFFFYGKEKELLDAGIGIKI